MGLFELFEEHVKDTVNKYEKALRKKLRSKSDKEIE